jgi:hypothetical protein
MRWAGAQAWPPPSLLFSMTCKHPHRGPKNELAKVRTARVGNTHTHANWNFLVFPDTVGASMSIMLLILSKLHGILPSNAWAPEVPKKAAKSAKNTLEVGKKRL